MALNLDSFRNEPHLDFTKPENIRKQREALEKVRKQFGHEYPNLIDGKEVYSREKLYTTNPAHPSEIVGIFQKGLRRDAEQALQAAWRAFEQWSNVPAEERALYLIKAAQEMRRRRMELNAWMISEVGKNYAEADADTCEAIDFLEYYAREAIRYAQPQPVTPVPGERNEYFYIPLGAGVIIPPWNFPLAILTGMASAAIVSGNTVVVKPSSESPMMGWLLADIFRRVGLPEGVLNLVVGSGSEVGDFLVAHPRTRFIAFTGSMEVGLRIHELAAKPQPGQLWIKRTILEMGGKDAIIVDSEADLEAAVQGVVLSAYGYQGQKCSACSRAIVDKAVYADFVHRLKQAVKGLRIGDPAENYEVGPVISARAQESILYYIQIGRQEGRLLVGGNPVGDLDGYYIEPTVFINVPPRARLAQEEIFGPVLAVLKANSFVDAIRIANGTIYGLTGSVYSRNPDKLRLARDKFHVGNLYFNRKCTGALVGGHPFGGFNMSGTDSKAGGPDYLLLFLQGKSVSEKLY
ncbi:MAG: L-glutamate gamma-semialdehyde dehydrogenase [Candidatus Kapabacteria bacterium]|nr:L-glutamate gamma-semialdehyde dehydrogenase [Candidatus Kapabacteria bacterium]MCS7169633.1 L-glutamate gamma-semialdehyde dehydrogenase [Candidatus Kapabacteria bacterium]MDW7997623.1 L-glutamate gamma-semialdehyde dehydrogenase [Bacteroidota bacterium]MDW8224928.1 L-glutamate gamma-semialdehyde dehydrogenase [Bacteroidota bacterium]